MRLVNRRARRDYQILEVGEAGMVLTGAEVKSLRQGRGNLNEAFVRIKDGEAWVHNLMIPRYNPAGAGDYDPTRTRKLLLKRAEILAWEKKMEGKNLTLIPLECYSRDRYLKLKVGLARGRREYEKREVKKRRDLDREVARTLKGLRH